MGLALDSTLVGAFPELVHLTGRPIHISSIGPQALGSVFTFSLAPVSAAVAVASVGYFVPFRLSQTFVCINLWVQNGTGVAGTFDVGVYSKSAEKLVSLGSTTQAGASVTQKVTLGTPLVLPVGVYYMAFSASTVTTATYWRTAPTTVGFCQAAGMAQVAAQTPLAQSPTLAVMASAYVPIFGLGGRATI